MREKGDGGGSVCELERKQHKGGGKALDTILNEVGSQYYFCLVERRATTEFRHTPCPPASSPVRLFTKKS